MKTLCNRIEMSLQLEAAEGYLLNGGTDWAVPSCSQRPRTGRTAPAAPRTDSSRISLRELAPSCGLVSSAPSRSCTATSRNGDCPRSPCHHNHDTFRVPPSASSAACGSMKLSAMSTSASHPRSGLAGWWSYRSGVCNSKELWPRQPSASLGIGQIRCRSHRRPCETLPPLLSASSKSLSSCWWGCILHLLPSRLRSHLLSQPRPHPPSRVFAISCSCSCLPGNTSLSNFILCLPLLIINYWFLDLSALSEF